MRQTSDEQLEEIWSRAEGDNIYATRTTDQWGNEITLFDGWKDVEKIADIVYEALPQQMIDDYQPTFANRDYTVDGRYHIEWAIGDFGFTDQYDTCSHCYVAIDTQDYDGPRYWYDEIAGDLLCDTCIKANPRLAEEYLAYCARHLGDRGVHTFIAQYYFCEPSEYGYICINPYTAYGEYRYDDFLMKYEGLSNFPREDHAYYKSSLDYADDKAFARLGKSLRLIDPNIQMIAQCNFKGYGPYLYWAKFETDLEPEVSPEVNLRVLQYAISLVMMKYHKLYLEGK